MRSDNLNRGMQQGDQLKHLHTGHTGSHRGKHTDLDAQGKINKTQVKHMSVITRGGKRKKAASVKQDTRVEKPKTGNNSTRY